MEIVLRGWILLRHGLEGVIVEVLMDGVELSAACLQSKGKNEMRDIRKDLSDIGVGLSTEAEHTSHHLTPINRLSHFKSRKRQARWNIT